MPRDLIYNTDTELGAEAEELRAYKKANGHDAESGKRRFNPVRFKDIRLNTDRAYLVKGLIPREGLTVVWGPPKCGKSFFVYDLVMHTALGWTYRERKVQRGVVVYIAAEGERGLAARTEAYRQIMLSSDADPDFYLLTTRLDLVADVDQLIADVQAAIGEEHCAAVVIDTLNRTIAGSESRDEDMGCYVKAADHLREAFRAAVIIIHHCGMNGERPRGHTSLTGACDAQIAVRKDDGGRIIATVEHMKDGAEGEIIASRLRAVEAGLDDDGDVITSCVVEPADDEPMTEPQRRLSAAQGRALQMLSEAIGTGGEVPPTNNHIPNGMRCVAESLWREYCYRGAVSAGDQDAKQKAFKRAAEALVAAGRVGKWEPWVWLT
jgi:KaiC/GvpD/RAD55 family RecA-like ATPase